MTTKLTPDEAMDALAALRPADDEITNAWYIGRREHNVQTVFARVDAPAPARTVVPRRRPSVWWFAVPTAVAAVAAAVLLIPGAIGPRPIEAVPIQTPTATPSQPAEPAADAWSETAPPPLSGRRDAVTAWVDGRYLIVGGSTDAPCDPNGTCPDSEPLTDGALFDPATGTWTTIADAPTGLAQSGGASNPYPESAVVGDTVYIQALGGTVLAYHPGSDTWTTLPTPPWYRPAALAGSFDNQLILFPTAQCTGPDEPCRSDAATDYFAYDLTNGGGRNQFLDLAIPSSVNGATVVGDQLVISWLVDENTLGTALVNLATDEVTVLPDKGIGQRPAPVTVGGYAAWPRDPDTAWFLNPTTQGWTSVELPATSGPLTGDTGAWPITIGQTIALGGHPYNPATQILWDNLPALPIPDRAPTLVGGADAALACFGYDSGRAAYNDTCRLLVLNPPTGVPSVAPTPDVNSTHVATEPAPTETFDAPSVAPSPAGQSTP